MGNGERGGAGLGLLGWYGCGHRIARRGLGGKWLHVQGASSCTLTRRFSRHTSARQRAEGRLLFPSSRTGAGAT